MVIVSMVIDYTINFNKKLIPIPSKKVCGVNV